jgi:hypothetical protein
MTESSPLPSRHSVRSLLEGLTGKDIDIKDGSPIAAGPNNTIAVFVTDKLATAAVAVVDLAGAARLGGALGMLPKGGVDDAIDTKDLYSPIKENCYEVLNVLSAVFNVADAPHVKLYQMYGPGESVPSDIAHLASMLGSRMDVSFTISGYGDGQLSLVVR